MQLTQEEIHAINTIVKQHGLRETARQVGVAVNTLRRAISSKEIANRTVQTLRRSPPKVRQAGDFKKTHVVVAPRIRAPILSWSLEAIRDVLSAQMQGRFITPKRLAEAMRRSDAIYAARENRIAPISAVATKLVGSDCERGRAMARRAEDSVQISRTVLAGIESTCVDHGVAIGYVEHTPNKSGTRVDMKLTEWPLEHVRYNGSTQQLETTTDGDGVVPITHGDSRWIRFQRYAITPWREDATILPGAFVWASHTEGVVDWAGSSKAHGLAKIIGELPQGSSINDASGELGLDARDFVAMMIALAQGDSSFGLKPFGSKIDFLSSASNAWQIFKENVLSREKAAARIYLGTDATLGSISGSPGIDIAMLFGVATTKMQGDFWRIEAGINSGLLEPWTAINHGSTRYAPKFCFDMPDPDRSKRQEEKATSWRNLFEMISSMRASKLEVTQEAIDRIAKDFGIAPAPRLAAIDQQVATIDLAPTDVAQVVRAREARASQGLGPFGDERDDMMIAELKARGSAT